MVADRVVPSDPRYRIVRTVLLVASKARSPLVAKVTEEAGRRIGWVSLRRFPDAPVPLPVAVSVKIPPVVEVMSSLRPFEASVNEPYTLSVLALVELRSASVFAASRVRMRSFDDVIPEDDQAKDPVEETCTTPDLNHATPPEVSFIPIPEV